MFLKNNQEKKSINNFVKKAVKELITLASKFSLKWPRKTLRNSHNLSRNVGVFVL